MWKENLQNIHANDAKEFLLGGTSTMDQVFLSHQCPRVEAADFTIDVCNNKLDKASSPIISSPRETFDFSTDNKKTNCYQVTLSSFVLIAITCFLLLVCRDYIKDLLVWMENVDLTVSLLIFLVLYTIVSYPMAWGVILLMIACGYLYGLIYGPIVVEVCSAVGVAIAHVTMKKFCRSFIIKKFYNDNMTAVISVVGGKHGFKVVALTRLTPLPFGLQNSLFSVSIILFMFLFYFIHTPIHCSPIFYKSLNCARMEKRWFCVLCRRIEHGLSFRWKAIRIIKLLCIWTPNRAQFTTKHAKSKCIQLV